MTIFDILQKSLIQKKFGQHVAREIIITQHANPKKLMIIDLLRKKKYEHKNNF